MVDRTARHITKFKTQKEITLFGFALSLIDIVILMTIGLILVFQLQLQFTQKVNWDEFFYLSHIYDAQAGRLDKTLQMGHVYLFRWLPFWPGGEMAQITVGRVVMWAAQLGTLTLIIKTARRFIPITYALFAGLCFLGLGFVFVHGTSFRADPLAGLCMMGVTYVLAASDLKRPDLILLTTALVLGAFITIKVILFAPLFAALAVWRLSSSADKKLLFIKLVVTALVSSAIFITALLLHRLTLPLTGAGDSTSSLTSTAHTALMSDGLFPRKDIIIAGFYRSLVPTIMIGLGIVIATYKTFKDKANRHRHLIILALALPLITFAFYRNAYPYFYAFIYPSAIILSGYSAYKLKLSNLIMIPLCAFIFCSTVLLHSARSDETRAVQAETLDAVHRIFPDPASYFDRSGMISSFPKAGFFMSSWGLKTYNISGELQFMNEMETETIPLLIENSPEISSALRGGDTALLADDALALRLNYIPHWGHIWVAGKTLDVSSESMKITILIPGVYTVESVADISINGINYPSGSQISLGRGAHTVFSNTPQTATLRWGDNLHRPSGQPPKMPIFGAF